MLRHSALRNSALKESPRLCPQPAAQFVRSRGIGMFMKKPCISIVSLLGMFFIIGVAHKLDIWIENIRRATQKEFPFTNSWLVPANIALLLLVGLLFIWLWFVNYKDSNIRVVAIIYMLVGLGLLFYNSIAIALTPKLNLQLLLPVAPQSLSAFASAFIAIVGIQRLFSRKVTL